jgi:putative tricarboxylic transport membrane protein
MLQGLMDALGVLFDWPNPLWVVGGVLFGMLIGFLPGMAGSVALALLIPLSFTMETELAVLFLIAAYSPSGFGGMLTSILVNTPGAPENAATTFDGYPMAQQGRAGAAIGAATAASVVGGLLGTAALIAIVPVAQAFILSFSYPEFFMMAVLGLTVIAVVTERNTFKAIIAAALGFLIAFIGLNPITGSPRFTFEQIYLYDGVGLVPVLMGLFAGAEVLSLFGKGTMISKSAVIATDSRRAGAAALEGPVSFWDGVRETSRHKFLVVRSSMIGTVIGVIPGVGGAVSGFLAYSQAKQTSKHPERFGKGAIEGVIAAESANDAKEGGSLIPTVAFGIPGTVGMAVLLGALIMQGVPAGPTLLVDHIDLIYILVLGMVASKFVAPVVVWLVAKRATQLTTLRPGIFTPIIAVAALIGAYTVNLQILDVVVTVIFGYLGYAMRRYGYSRVALIIALVLGGLVERTYYQTVSSFGDASVIIQRPISAVLLTLTVVFLGYAVYSAVRRRVSSRGIGNADEPEDEDELTGHRQPGGVIFTAMLLVFAIIIVVSASSIPSDARILPLIIGWIATVGLAFQLIRDVLPFVWRPGEHKDRAIPTAEFEEASLDAPRSDGEGRSLGSVNVLSKQGAGVVELSGRTVLRRQAMFALWAIGFVVLSAFAGFAVAIPVSLVIFLRFLAKESWIVAITVAVVTVTLLYLLFDLTLGRSVF